jgi:hypothetical protein
MSLSWHEVLVQSFIWTRKTWTWKQDGSSYRAALNLVEESITMERF